MSQFAPFSLGGFLPSACIPVALVLTNIGASFYLGLNGYIVQ
tara:strand:- start:4 stop:129 length:126 start_codon:yes stop_codon:yes gene_type:complete